jgi:NAD(P)H-hydrate epimerase
MDVITSEEMAVLDINCEYFGLSRLQLMENAGRGLAEEIIKRFSPCKVVIFAGLGNNGGDAFVCARFLKDFDVEVYLLGRAKDIRTDIAKRNFEILKLCSMKIKEIRDEIPKIDADIVIDGILGTGVKGRLRGIFAKAVEAINESKAFKVAVDVPTGLNPDTGEYDLCVKADLTVTFHKAKPGLLKAKDVVGELVVKDIGIPKEFENLAGVGDVQKVYKRFDDAHKGMHGRILVLGGKGYTGAVSLTSLACYYAGADLVTTVVSPEVKEVVASFSPNLIVRSIDFKLSSLETLEELMKKHHVAVLGMGVERSDEFRDFVEEFLKLDTVKKVVLDASALTKDVPEDVECIMTPHAGEFKLVFGEPKIENVKKTARETNSVILLKGKKDVITDGERVRYNVTGNAGMTVGGTGDVLAGIVGAFFALNDAFWSASAGAFVNGLAGDLCLEEKGYNFTAVDLLEKIPIAIKRALEFR